MRLNLIDWSMAYFLLSGIVLIIPSIIVFATNKSVFSWYYFVQGFGGSFCSCIAGTLADYALGLKHAPPGPTVAFLNVRIVIVVVVDALLNQFMPSYIQWIGLIIGIAGTLILSMPDQLLQFFNWVV